MTELKKRGWPLLVITSTRTIHISRENAPDCKVRCDCGRTIDYRSTYSNDDDRLELLQNAENGTVKPKYGWESPYKLCSGCGSKEAFVEAFEEYVEKHGAFTNWLKAEREFMDDYEKKVTQAFCNSFKKLAESLPVTDIKEKNLGVTFTISSPSGDCEVYLGPTEDEQTRLIKSSREVASEKYREENPCGE